MLTNVGIILFIFILGIFVILQVQRYRFAQTPGYNYFLSQTDNLINKIELYKKNYFTYEQIDEIKDEYLGLQKLINESKMYYKLNKGKIDNLNEIILNIESLAKTWNDQFVNNELELFQEYFDDIDGKKLDMQQRLAVVVDDSNNLILAGAGSGKTLTISGKVKYLVEKKGVDPSEILLISFTRKSAQEMQERINTRLRINVHAKTFHGLGLEISSKGNGKRLDVFDDLDLFIDKYFEEELKSDIDAMTLITNFYGLYFNLPIDMEKVKNLGDVHDLLKSFDLVPLKAKVDMIKKVNDIAEDLRKERRTLKMEKVRSLEEVTIANYLYLNGIEYEYEKKYPYDTGDEFRKHYQPDFYLPQYDLYIEHFGVTRDLKAPWLPEIEEAKYINGIEWKREVHEINQTTLLETYSYFFQEGILLIELDRLLKSNGVSYKPMDFKDIYTNAFQNQLDTQFNELKKLIATFINLFKSRNFNGDSFANLLDVAGRMENKYLQRRTELFLRIVSPIYNKYDQMLNHHEKIDFHDMINKATQLVKENSFSLNYKYIIIDEYQDISMSRFNLIREIKKQTKAKLICVGDDWQSIYRFAGSDVNLFTSFEKYIGRTQLLKIENTYRNSQELIDIAMEFVMKNPQQLKKSLKSIKREPEPLRIVIDNQYNMTNAIEKTIEEIVKLDGDNTEIMILGRNNFDLDFLDDESVVTFEFKRRNNQIILKYLKYPKLNLHFSTVHKSKGLEAKNVIVINLKNSMTGFPNKIADDPILSLILTEKDSFEYAEERRLFYVAITRTKNLTYLIAPELNYSTFVEELIKDFKIIPFITNPNESLQDNPRCTKCMKGYLVIRKNQNETISFLGCSNYPFCDKSFKQLEILKDKIVCPKCHGYMIKRSSSYGEFYGCTNYPDCRTKLQIEINKNKFEFPKIKT